MRVYTTNYFDSFIEVAEDCPATLGVVPRPRGGQPTVASLQFDLLQNNPYRYTSDDLLFMVFAIRKDIPESEWGEQKSGFFSKGQACLRASPLTKTYGWGVHSNAMGKVAIYGMETEAYRRFQEDPALKKLKAMRSKRA